MAIKMMVIMSFSIQMFDLINNDILFEIMLRIDIIAFHHFYLLSKNIKNIADDIHFWQKKLVYFGLPKIVFDNNRTIEEYTCEFIQFRHIYIKLFLEMQIAQDRAKKILLISDAINDTVTNDTIIIMLSKLYNKFKFDDFLKMKHAPKRIHYKKSFIKIKNKASYYEIRCFMFNKHKKRHRISKITYMNKYQMITCLTMFLFDSSTIIRGGNKYIDNHGLSILPIHDCGAFRLAMWVMLEYQQQYNLITL